MKNKKTVLILILVFVLLLGGAYALYTQLGSKLTANQLATSQTDTGDAQKAIAPDFTVYDADGGEVRLSTYIGKPIVLNFWASWCGPCRTEMPDFHKVYQEIGNDVQFLMINMTDGSRETVEIASSFVAQQGYTFPVFYDTKAAAASAYGAYALPTTFFIDAQGYVVAQARGMIDHDTLLRGIEMIAPQGE